MDEISDWFATDLGQQLLAAEQTAFDRLAGSIFGYHLLQVGILPDCELYQQACASHKFLMVPRPQTKPSHESVVGASSDLPFASDCIDAVVLHHALDFTDSPHQVLREAARVLRPGGKLVNISFNPFSFWGLYRLVSSRKQHVPWCGSFLSQRRLHDWLTLLEFKQERLEAGFYRPPLKSRKWMERLSRLERWGQRSFINNGAFQVSLATKETLAMTPLAKGWRRRLVLPLVNKPLQQASRNHSKPISRKTEHETVK